jgi:hypothetical protein
MRNALSSFKFKRKNAELVHQKFWTSFIKVMELKDIDASDKMSLVRTRKAITEEVELIMESVKTSTEDQRRDILLKEYTADFKPVNVPLDELSSEDMYQLQGLINIGE